MAIGVIKEDEAAQLISVLNALHWLITWKVITQEEADTVKQLVNDKLHEALGLE